MVERVAPETSPWINGWNQFHRRIHRADNYLKIGVPHNGLQCARGRFDVWFAFRFSSMRFYTLTTKRMRSSPNRNEDKEIKQDGI